MSKNPKSGKPYFYPRPPRGGRRNAVQLILEGRSISIHALREDSPLVKTCIAGHDCNWGRVAMALGKCGVKFNQEDVSIDMMGMPVCRDGLTVPFDEDEALRRFEASEIVISADLGAGDAATTVWTCDLTHEYISINGDYRS